MDFLFIASFSLSCPIIANMRFVLLSIGRLAVAVFSTGSFFRFFSRSSLTQTLDSNQTKLVLFDLIFTEWREYRNIEKWKEWSVCMVLPCKLKIRWWCCTQMIKSCVFLRKNTRWESRRHTNKINAIEDDAIDDNPASKWSQSIPNWKRIEFS